MGMAGTTTQSTYKCKMSVSDNINLRLEPERLSLSYRQAKVIARGVT